MLQRMLIEKIESRILVGTAMFLGLMLLVGWVIIKEEARMREVDTQHQARAIERGAVLFAASCATCHGTDGLGGPRAPGLNNPQLFGHNYYAAVDSEIARIEAIPAEVEAIEAILNGEEQILSTERETLETRLAAIREEYGEDLNGVDQRLTELAAERQSITNQLQAAIDNGYNPEEYDRLAQVEWGSTLDAFLSGTISAGRPVSANYWPEAMAAWSQDFGGQLRRDEVSDLVAYIKNWDRNWTVEDLLAVNQFALVPVVGELAEVEEVDVLSRLDAILTLTGDPQNGQVLYTQQGCQGCHLGGSIGPDTIGTWTRINEIRLNEEGVEGYTAHQYLLESIIDPNAHIPEGYTAGLMPTNFGNLSDQDLADLMSYVESQDQ